MRIGVNLLPFRAQLAGAGRYASNILRELLCLDTQNHYFLFVTPAAAPHFDFGAPNTHQITVRLAESAAARIAYEQFVLPIQLMRHKIQILFTPSVAIPLVGFGKRVTVIHDMIAEHREVKKYPPLRNAYIRWMSRYAAQHSDVVITVSEDSRREIAQYARVPLDKISVAPDGVDRNFRPVRDAETLQRVRDIYRLPERFVLYVGTLEPGKNLVRLVQAFAQMKREHPALEHHLVLAGAQGWGVREIENEIQRSDATGFHLIGFVEEEDLAALYALSDVFVLPSLYEGFGLPALEAMACGTPVIVSNVSALPEVIRQVWAGPEQRAGILVSPTNVNEMANAMARVLSDEALRARLSAAGLERARQFRWETSAQVILERISAQAK